jgi:hypothetical protein
MRVAMDIGVSCDHVSRFYRYLWHATVTMFGSEYMYKGTAAPLVRSAVAKGCGERRMSLSVNLVLGGGNRVIRAQRIC